MSDDFFQHLFKGIENIDIEDVLKEHPPTQYPECLYGEMNPFYGKTHTDEWKKNQSLKTRGENNPFYGKKHSEETKKKLSEYTKNQVFPPRTEEWNNKIRESLTGKRFTKERCENISKSKKGKPSPIKGMVLETIICPHCKKQGSIPNMKRWHFDNCKEKK